LLRCKPPLAQSEVDVISRSASKFTPAKDLEGGADPTMAPGDPWKRADANAIFREELLPAVWVCEALQLGPGRPFGIWGTAGAGKTLVASALALSVASGRPLFGRFEVKRGRVLHISYDSGTRAVRKRYRQLALGLGLEWSEVDGQIETSVFPDIYLNSKGAAEAFAELCKGFDLVVIDNFRDAVPGEEENGSELAQFLKIPARISEATGCTFVYLHHMRKNQGEPTLDSGRGSGAIVAASGAIWALTGSENEPREMKLLRCADDADGWVEPFRVRLVMEPAWTFSVEESGSRAGAARENLGVGGDVRFAVLKHFETHGEWAGSVPALAKSLGKRKDAVAAVIAEMKTSGKLSDVGTYHQPRLLHMQSGPIRSESGPGPDGECDLSGPYTTPPPKGGGRTGPDNITGGRTRRRTRSSPGPDHEGEGSK
jgi:hypothetical protein